MKDESKPPKKILVLGPCKSGKTAISNYLGEQVDIESLGEYRPTKGVRIVEFESHELDIRRQRIEVDVELWDCSGDLKYRDCWPAIRDGIEGVILVANPDENTGEDLKIW
nr:CRE-IFTA-2 protein [Haemonchus contortus]